MCLSVHLSVRGKCIKQYIGHPSFGTIGQDTTAADQPLALVRADRSMDFNLSHLTTFVL